MIPYLQPVEDEELLEYLYRRGVSDSLRESLQVSTWRTPTEPVDLPGFADKFKSYGERLDGKLLFPFKGPRGNFLGFEARSIQEKRVYNYRLPEAHWTPCWLGLTTETMGRIWAGEDVWICEGFFDVVALMRSVDDVVLSSTHAGLSPLHVKFLGRFTRGVVHMCYDNDETGYKQTHGYRDEKTGKFHWGAVQRLQKEGVRVVVHQYSGKDPGAVWDRGGDFALKQQFGKR